MSYSSLKVIQRVGRYVQDAKLSLIEVRVQSAVGAKRDAEVSAWFRTFHYHDFLRKFFLKQTHSSLPSRRKRSEKVRKARLWAVNWSNPLHRTLIWGSWGWQEKSRAHPSQRLCLKKSIPKSRWPGTMQRKRRKRKQRRKRWRSSQLLQHLVFSSQNQDQEIIDW